jgi:hypothetical protein
MINILKACRLQGKCCIYTCSNNGNDLNLASQWVKMYFLSDNIVDVHSLCVFGIWSNYVQYV